MAYTRKFKDGDKVATTVYLDHPVDAAVSGAALAENRKKGPFISLLLARKFAPKIKVKR